MKSRFLAAVLSSLALSALAALPAAARDFLLTTTKPNTLHMVDVAARKVVRSYPIPGEGSPLGMVVSPDGKVAYMTTNHWGSLVGIDLDSGEQVFRADFSQGDIRSRNTFGLEISPDGKELFVMLSAARLGQAEYEVLDSRIAVYRTDAGLDARPVRLLPVPRRTTSLLMSKDGTRLWALSWDIHTLDPADGRELKVDKIANWDRTDRTPPDVFGNWIQHEQTGLYAGPYYTTRPDLPATDPAAARTGMMTLDTATGALTMAEFENTEAIMFSTVINPVRRNETFSVYNTLTKTDLAANALVKRVKLPHTYYCLNISADGREVYLGGTVNDIGIYSTETLERIGQIDLPGGNDMGGTWMRMIKRGS
jgi:quinohemoprotein amine dehydrogenase beta subunit